MGTGSLASIFKAYDVRGVVPDELDARRAYAIGTAFGRFAAEHDGAERVLVAVDMRESGEELARAVMAGAASTGIGVVDLGLASTDLLYFASGHLDAPGAMLTASHNPPRYNGMKFCFSGARPIGQDTGLADIRRLAEEALDGAPEDGGASAPADAEHLDLLGRFAEHVRSFVDVSALAPLRVVADTANGMGGLVAPAVFAGLPVSLEVLYGELDGTFPNHPADPIQPENLVDLRALILERGADIGLAFDGDADRVFLVDERGEPLSGSTTTAIVAEAMLEKHPGSTVLYNLHLLEDGARGRARERRDPDPHRGSGTPSSSRSWPRPARSSAASTRATTTSGTTSGPTRASSPPSWCWRCFPGRASPSRSCASPSSATPTPARSTPGSTTRRPSSSASSRRTAPRVPRSTSWTG